MYTYPDKPLPVLSFLEEVVKLTAQVGYKVLPWAILASLSTVIHTYHVALGVLSGARVVNVANIALLLFMSFLIPIFFAILAYRTVNHFATARSIDLNDDLIECFKRFPKVLLTLVMYAVLTAIGFMLLIIPGIYLMVAGSLSLVIASISELSAYDSLRESLSLVKGHWWRVLLIFVIVAFPIALVRTLFALNGIENQWVAMGAEFVVQAVFLCLSYVAYVLILNDLGLRKVT